MSDASPNRNSYRMARSGTSKEIGKKEKMSEEIQQQRPRPINLVLQRFEGSMVGFEWLVLLEHAQSISACTRTKSIHVHTTLFRFHILTTFITMVSKFADIAKAPTGKHPFV